METISNFFAAVAAFFSWKGKKVAADNTPEMQAAARAKADQEIKDKARADIAAGKIEEIRTDLAE